MFGWDPEEGIYLQHATIETTLRLIDGDLINDWFKFAVVRNPFSRIASCFYYLYEQSHREQYGDFASYVTKIPEQVPTANFLRGSHLSRQISYTHLSGNLFCDSVSHFETLPESLAPVRERLKLSTNPPKLNSARSPTWPSGVSVAELYTPEMTRIVQDVYEADFRAYGYSACPEQLTPQA